MKKGTIKDDFEAFMMNEGLWGLANEFSMDEMHGILSKFIEERNAKPLSDFEGLSPQQMKIVCDEPWSAKSPIQFKTLKEASFEACPIFCQVHRLLSILEETGGVKLTATGALPVKIVKELYPLSVPDSMIEKGYSKINREAACPTVQRAHFIAKIAKLIKIRQGKMQLTRSGQIIYRNKQKLLELMLMTFMMEFNMGYFDRYNSSEIGQLGAAFTLILLERYGKSYRIAQFYADKYFKAFPFLREDYSTFYGDLVGETTRCYVVRSFERFLLEFGLIQWSQKGYSVLDSEKNLLKTTALFHQLFRLAKS